MRTMEEIRTQLQNHRTETVAAETGISYNTIRTYMSGRVATPRPLYLKALNDWLDQKVKAGTAA